MKNHESPVLEMPKKTPKPKKSTTPSQTINLEDSSRSSKKQGPVPKKDGLVRKDAALFRLGVTQKEIDRAPNISDMLKRVLGSPYKAIDALRFSSEPAAIAFLEVYDEIPSGDNVNVPIEAICIKAGVSPALILGATIMSAKTMAAQESALHAMMAHPDIVGKTIQFARTFKGSKDRKMLHEAVGFLPTPKGGNISVNLGIGGSAQLVQSDGEDESADDDASFKEAFPTINKNLDKWANDRKKLLED